ncbi:MAG: class I SAM-dependent methyltransferase [Myxococcota bacterium]
MNRPTLLALNQINRAFYRTVAADFSATRRSAWPGFARAARHIEEALPGDTAPQVLDVGCGNGRFADALLGALDEPFAYLGVDASEALLAEPRARHAGRPGFRFVTHDFVLRGLGEVLDRERFRVVLLLGMLHHVPGAATRARLLGECVAHLAPGGLLVLTLWRFERLERLRRRIVPWEEIVRRGGPTLDPAQLEPGDHLLRFGPKEGPLRYCHAFAEEESRELLSGLPLEGVDDWLADGETGDLNRWVLLRAV